MAKDDLSIRSKLTLFAFCLIYTFPDILGFILGLAVDNDRCGIINSHPFYANQWMYIGSIGLFVTFLFSFIGYFYLDHVKISNYKLKDVSVVIFVFHIFAMLVWSILGIVILSSSDDDCYRNDSIIGIYTTILIVINFVKMLVILLISCLVCTLVRLGFCLEFVIPG